MPTGIAIMLGLILAAMIFLLITAGTNEPLHRASEQRRARSPSVGDLEAQKAQWEQIWSAGADPQWTDQLGWIPTPVHPENWKERP